MSNRDEHFLSRWSRLKRARDEERKVGRGSAAPVVSGAPAQPVRARAPVAPCEGNPDSSRPEDTATPERSEPSLDLPDIDSLTKDSDYTPFLRPGVAPDVQRMALRKLWRSDPMLANLDGLNDYDEDFGAQFSGVRVVKTAYRIGRGFLEDENEAKEPDTVPGATSGSTSSEPGRQTTASEGEKAEQESRPAGDSRSDDPHTG